MELDRAHSYEGKCNRGGGYGAELTRTKEKRRAKEGLAENNTRGSPDSWDDMREIKQLSKSRVRWRHLLMPYDPVGAKGRR
jgi:hypothetical protein